jgi:hypothetical protein
VVALTTSRARDAGAEVPGIVVELTTAVAADEEPAATVDDTSGATFDGALDSGLGVLDVVPTSVDSGTVSAATVVEGADDAVAVGPLAVAGSAFSPVEHAVTAKYIHTPSPMRTSVR